MSKQDKLKIKEYVKDCIKIDILICPGTNL